MAALTDVGERWLMGIASYISSRMRLDEVAHEIIYYRYRGATEQASNKVRRLAQIRLAHVDDAELKRILVCGHHHPQIQTV